MPDGEEERACVIVVVTHNLPVLSDSITGIASIASKTKTRTSKTRRPVVTNVSTTNPRPDGWPAPPRTNDGKPVQYRTLKHA